MRAMWSEGNDHRMGPREEDAAYFTMRTRKVYQAVAVQRSSKLQ